MPNKATNPTPRGTNGRENRDSRHPQEPKTVNSLGEYFSRHHHSSPRPTNIRGLDHVDRTTRPRNESSHHASVHPHGPGDRRGTGHDARYEQIDRSTRHGSSTINRQEPGSRQPKSRHERGAVNDSGSLFPPRDFLEEDRKLSASIRRRNLEWEKDYGTHKTQAEMEASVDGWSDAAIQRKKITGRY